MVAVDLNKNSFRCYESSPFFSPFFLMRNDENKKIRADAILHFYFLKNGCNWLVGEKHKNDAFPLQLKSYFEGKIQLI